MLCLLIVHLQPSGSGAGGSASGLGPEGRRFESGLPDVKRRLLGAFFCDPGAIRTRDRFIRSEMLYPAELRDPVIERAKVVLIRPLAYF